MASDSDFFKRLFDHPPDGPGDEVPKRNLKNFAEFLDNSDQDEGLREFVDRRRKERMRDKFEAKVRKKKSD